MAYAFTNALQAAVTTRVRFAVQVPTAWRGQSVTLTRRQEDDRVNWFPQWRKDRKELGLTDDRFSWSPDDPSVLGESGLLRAEDRAKFQETLLPRYRELSRLKPVTQNIAPQGDQPLVIDLDLQVNSAAFLELREGK